YCIGRFYQFERLPRLIVESARGFRLSRDGEFEIPRDISRIPNRRIFAAEPIKREPASLLIAHLAQLVNKRDRIQKPDGMLLIFILKIKIRAVSRASHFRALDFGVISAAHRFRKTDHLSFSSADRPIVSVTADCEDPLL